jgi:energy-coupling factor transporter ATP-binding protein EcfA2
MAITLKKASATRPFQRRVFIYGKSGAGKTFLIGSLAKVQPLKEILVVPLDAGDATLDGTDVTVTENVRKLRDAEEVLWAVMKREGDFAGVKTLVLDGVSEAAKRELQEIAEAAAKSASPNKPRDRDENQLRDYMLRNGRLLRILRMARDIPNILLVLTGWPKEVFPKVGDVTDTSLPPLSISPDFSDKLTDTVLGSLDDVWYLKVDAEGKRLLYTGDFQNIRAKTRGEAFASELGTTKDGKFFPILVNPTFSDIVAAYDRAMAKQQQANSKEQVK